VQDMENKYNYIFLSIDQDDINMMYSDLNTTGYTQYIALPKDKTLNIHNRFFKYLCRIHTSSKANKIIKLPFRSVWDRAMFSFALNSFDTKPICFILNGICFELYGDQLTDYLHRTHPGCKLVLYLGDLIKMYKFDIVSCKNIFNIVANLEKGESIYYDLFYCEEPFSFHQIKKNPVLDSSDVTFVGFAKGRLRDILTIYEILDKAGLRCDFHITGVPENQQKYADKISYNKRLSFYEVLQHVIASKCILEVLQEGMTSPTTRVSEAIAYGKKLLSNCLELKGKPYYNPNFISVFTDPKDIDVDFITEKESIIDYKYIDKLSPIHFINNIEKILNK
jgi:hypothetical protein